MADIELALAEQDNLDVFVESEPSEERSAVFSTDIISYRLVTECTKHTDLTTFRAVWSIVKVILYFLAVCSAFIVYNFTFNAEGSSACSADDETSAQYAMFFIGFAASGALVFELAFAAISLHYAGVYYTELFRLTRRADRLRMCTLKSLPNVTSVYHFFLGGIILWAWLVFYTTADAGCDYDSNSDYWIRYIALTLVATIFWFIFVLAGSCIRQSYRLNAEMYYPPLEVSESCCGFDLMCSTYERRKRPRCCRALYRFTTPKRDVGNSNNNPNNLIRDSASGCLSKAIMYIGECSYRFWKGLGMCFYRLKRSRHEIGP